MDGGTGGPPAGFGKAVNDYYNHYIGIADAKAGVIASAAGAEMLLLAANRPRSGAGGEYVEIGLFVVAIATVLVALWLSLLIVRPRLPGRGGEGVIFWEHVRTASSPEEYIARLRELDARAIEDAYARQNHAVAGILVRKFEATTYALGMLGASVPLTALYMAAKAG